MLEDISGRQRDFTFPRFARALRYASLIDGTRLNARRRRRPQFVSNAIDTLKRAGKRYAVVRVVGRTSLGVLRTLRASINRLGAALTNLPYVQRHTIRHIARMWLSVSGDAAPLVPGRALRASLWLIEKRIPIITPITRGTVETALLLALGAQMAAGHMGNTIAMARFLNLAFRPDIKRRRQPTAYLYYQALYHTRQYHRIITDLDGSTDLDGHYLNHILGAAHMQVGSPKKAISYFHRALRFSDRHPPDFRYLGRSYLRLGDEESAAECFRSSVALAPNTVMAHQNYAGRYNIPAYKPKAWELEDAGRLMIYDNYGQLAEDAFLLGRFEESFQFYQRMLDYQQRIRAPLPDDLVAQLRALDPRIDPAKPFRLLPYEWITQYGHIGLLDSYIKMAELGMYPDANRILLAPPDKVSNHEFLSYWDTYFTIVRDEALVDELFPYQRMIGDNFQAYPGEGGVAEPWTRAAARAHVEWARQKRAPLLQVSEADRAIGEQTLAALKVPKDAWYVGLHVRESGYYGESAGGISTHRNAAIEDYLPTIKAITDRGGYVIRLGDKSMRPLPPMERVIDYARSPHKSPQADIFFCSTSRFVIGTTSGLTTACLAFGTPMVLVNCISNDWQLWSADTDFIVKRVWDMRGKRYLTFSEAFTQPVQGCLINASVLRRKGLIIISNTPQEIDEAVRYKLDMLDGRIARPRHDEEPMAAYWRAMAVNPMMFGAAHPVAPFLTRHSELLAVPQAEVKDTPAGPASGPAG
ncbi:MAG TPA: TIGR04372 family glycosyltransferase [Hyphomicrobium sp.]|nr:TIGR04372 family glycosyltransferase [Hyphomicrobium sp.]